MGLAGMGFIRLQNSVLYKTIAFAMLWRHGVSGLWLLKVISLDIGVK
jgi:hypothetical protein